MLEVSDLYEIFRFHKSLAFLMWLILTSIGIYMIISLETDK